MDSAYNLALDAAKIELEKIQAEIRTLLLRKQRVESVISVLSPIVSRPDEDPQQPTFELSGPPKTAPLWAVIRNLMRDMDGFTAGQAGDAYEADTGTSLGPNRHQIIRNSLIRHPETFIKLDDGRWQVRVDGWFANRKEASEETS